MKIKVCTNDLFDCEGCLKPFLEEEVAIVPAIVMEEEREFMLCCKCTSRYGVNKKAERIFATA